MADGCTGPPAAAQPRRASLPAGGHPGSIVCLVSNAESPVSSQFYRVEWGISDLRLTGGFFSGSNADQDDYESTYERALTMLGQIKA